MAYSIIYGAENEQKNSKRSCRRAVLTAAVFCCFLWCVCFFWDEGREVLKLMLIPDNLESTVQAAEVFAQELGSGFSVADASKNFCMTVFRHGHSG